MAHTIFTSVYAQRGEIDRYDGFAVVRMCACTFITTPVELARALDWARASASSGNPARDRSMFVARMANVLAPAGTQLASRGNRQVLTEIVRRMRRSTVPLGPWNVPEDVRANLGLPLSETALR